MSRSASYSSRSRGSDSRSKRRRPRDRDRNRSRRAGKKVERSSSHSTKPRRNHAAPEPQVTPGAWSVYALQMSPWHYTGSSSMQPGFMPSSWGCLPATFGSVGGAMPHGYVRDFAEHRPDAYYAFEQAAVRSNSGGVQVSLSKRMCLDKHVPDFVACLSCWLRRNFGDPIQTKWRLQCLDLSHNLLVDESISHLMTSLRHNKVSLQRLILAGNRVTAAAVGTITEYIWDIPEALHEMDLSGNEISVASDFKGDDPVSALLRCFYNHSAYPHRVPRTEWVAGQREAFDIVPLILRIGGNFLQDPVQLLAQICEKGGRERVRLRPDAAVYKPFCDEFLSLWLPDLTRQRKLGEAAWDEQARRVCTPSGVEEDEFAVPDLDDLEEPLVQQAISEEILRLDCGGILTSDAGDSVRWAIAGLALALVQTPRKTSSEMIHELEAFVGNVHSTPLLSWLMTQLRTLRC